MKYKLLIISTPKGLALALPDELVADWQLKEGQYLELSDSDNESHVQIKRHYRLDDFVQQCDPTAPASTDASVWDSVPPQGREVI